MLLKRKSQIDCGVCCHIFPVASDSKSNPDGLQQNLHLVEKRAKTISKSKHPAAIGKMVG
jgi:hypothetical protein